MSQTKIIKKENKPQKKKKNWRINNSYRCFGILDVFLMIGVIILFLLPFIDIFLYTYAGSYNAINWEDYYSNESVNWNYTIDGTYIEEKDVYPVNLTKYPTNVQVFNMVNMYQEMRIATDKDNTKFKNISVGMRDYQFVMNHESDLKFVSQCKFPSKDIYTFYPLMLRLPIHIISGLVVTGGTTSTVLKGLPISFGSNWSSVWDNLDVYFYYVNDNNEGIGFRYGNQQFNGTTINRELITDFGTLKLRTYEINISSEFSYTIKYNNLGKPYPQGLLPQMTYHSRPLADNSPMKQYTDILGESVSDPNTIINDLLSTLPFAVGGDVPNALSFDEPLYEIYQLQGFPNPNQLPTIKASRCGYYVDIKKDFSCYQTANFSKQGSEYEDYQLLNGIEINDDCIYLGKVSLLKNTLYNILLYDLIIFGSYVGIVVIFIFTNKVPQKYKAFKESQQQYCQVRPKSEPTEPQPENTP